MRFLMRHPRATRTVASSAVAQLYRNELALLALEFGSDKGPAAHGYTAVYDQYLRERRHDPLAIAEIGLLMHKTQRRRGGGSRFDDAPSLRMWRNYLPQAHIIGFDIADFSSVEIPGCVTIQGDQSDRADLSRIHEHCPDGLDVVIDDALHASVHQQVTLAVLFPLLKSGGIYFIEDLHYQPEHTENPGVPKTRDLLQMLSTGAAPEASPSAAITDDEWRDLRKGIGRITMYDSQKHVGDRQRQVDALAVLEKT
jgi:hypothetical protein